MALTSLISSDHIIYRIVLALPTWGHMSLGHFDTFKLANGSTAPQLATPPLRSRLLGVGAQAACGTSVDTVGPRLLLLDGLGGGVVGLPITVGVVVLRFTVVLEDVGRQLDCGDSSAVSVFLCFPKDKQAPPPKYHHRRMQPWDQWEEV